MPTSTRSYIDPLPDFEIMQKRMPAIFIDSLLLHKIAAARANATIGAIDTAQMQCIIAATDILRSEVRHTPPSLSVWQSGCGLESNRWANQHIAMRCDSAAPGSISADTVNCNQSTNDTIPSAIHLSVLRSYRHTLRPTCTNLINVIRAQANAFSGDHIMGRTYLRDAKLMPTMQLFDAWSQLLNDHDVWVGTACDQLVWLPQGGYSLGNGDGADPRFAPAYIQHLHVLLKPIALYVHPHPSSEIAGIRALAGVAGTLAALASGLEKIANDLLLLCSGPDHGLGDFDFSSAGNDSTTLIGKSNPTAVTTLIMACVYARSQCAMVLDLAARGQLQLYTAFPLTAFALLESMDVLSQQARAFSLFIKELIPRPRKIQS